MKVRKIKHLFLVIDLLNRFAKISGRPSWLIGKAYYQDGGLVTATWRFQERMIVMQKKDRPLTGLSASQMLDYQC